MDYVSGSTGDIEYLNVDLFVWVKEIVGFREVMDFIFGMGFGITIFHYYYGGDNQINK